MNSVLILVLVTWIVRRMRFLVMTLAIVCSLVSTARAQSDGHWIVISSTSDPNHDWVLPTAESIHAELVEQGVEAWSSDRTSKRFERKLSSPPPAVNDAELARWAALSDGAVRDLALGEDERALEKLKEAQAFSVRVIEELNRNPQRAQKVLDTCLYMVRAVVATDSESYARDLAAQCRRLVPRGEPSPYMHPPAVADLLRQVDALGAKQSGALQVTSTPSGCNARLNGVLLGQTPVVIERLFPGRYRLQVECDIEQRGRVHSVNVGAGRTTVSVDWRFDTVIETRPTMLLRYKSPSDEKSHRLSDAKRIARALSAARVVVVSMPSERTMELALFDPAGTGKMGASLPSSGSTDRSRPLAFARIGSSPRGPNRSDVALAAGALSEGRCMDFTPSEPIALHCDGQEPVGVGAVPVAPVDRPVRRRPHGQFVAGMTLIGFGLSGLVTGYALLAPRATAAESWYADVDAGADGISSQERWLNLRKGIFASSSTGAAVLVAAMPLALPERDKTPWWAWLSGGAGIGLAAFSIAYGVTADPEPSVPCSDQQTNTNGVSRCVKRGEQTGLAVLTGVTAAPLITMPLVYLFRPSRAKLEPQAQIGRSGAYLGLRGQF